MSPDSSKPSLKRKNVLGTIVLVLIVGVLISSNIGKGPFNHKSGQVLGISFSNIFNFFNFSSSFSFIFKSEGLSKIVQDNLSGKVGEYTIYIVDLVDGENYSLKSSDIFPSASLYKLYLLAAVIKEIDSGNLKLEDSVSAKKSHLVEVFDGDDFGYLDIGSDEVIDFSVEEALERVGRVSDNFASIMLAEKIGWDKVQQMANELGATATVIKSPISTTSSDVGDFFKLLYEKKIVNEQVSNKIVEFLELNQLNNRIPAGVPEGVKVIHKTGELSLVRHDGGIVYLEPTSKVESQNTTEVSARAYVIVMMSKDLKDENEAIDTMASISKGVYEYFKGKKSNR